MKKKFTVYNDLNAIIDILTAKRETPRFLLLQSAREKTAEFFIPVSTLTNQHLQEREIKATAIIYLN